MTNITKEQPTNSIILSGIQPSGTLHLGNYLGAIKQWVALQEENEAYYCIVDLHAITVPYDVTSLPDRVLDAAALYIAAGVDPNRSTIFVQSHVSAHAELAWLLGTTTPYGELTRMTQFKDKAKKQQDATTLGLFSYPVLMAADILLYHADFVPVGDDQTQHVELTRDIAKRFNNRFGDALKIPQAYTPPTSARIMSLLDPTKKMSKSDNEKSYIALTDTPEVIRKKVMSAVTETEPTFSFEKSGPAVQNLLRIYQAVSNDTPADIEERFATANYKEFKETLANLLVENLLPLQDKYHEIRQDDDELRVLLGRGKHKAETTANQTLQHIKEVMGLL